MSTPARKRNYNWIALLLVFSPLMWTIPTFYYLRADTKAKNTACQSNLKTIAKNLIAEFPAANGGKFPAAKTWIKAIKNARPEIYRCSNDRVSHPVSYAMNGNLSGKKLSDIKNPSQVILMYETSSKQSIPFGTGEGLVDIGKLEVGQGRHNLVGYRFNYFLMADGTIREAGTLDEKKALRWTP